MNGRKVMEEIRKAHFERMKEMINGRYIIDEPERITMTQNVFDALILEVSSNIQLRVADPKEEPKAYIFGMEIEIIGDDRGYFSIGGLMKGVS